jgi:mannitol/fructose-specific phosphotransferase system IIA component (Ntr-type)
LINLPGKYVEFRSFCGLDFVKDERKFLTFEKKKMNIARFLKPELIKLEMETRVEFDPEQNLSPQRKLWMVKDAILDELVDLLEKSGNVCNRKKLYTDLLNREKKASTGIGKGIAVPHVRTMQARDFVMGFARSREGYDFDAMDNGLVHLFFVMVAPPYDDNLYLRVFKGLAQVLQYDFLREKLISAKDEYEILRTIREME